MKRGSVLVKLESVNVLMILSVISKGFGFLRDFVLSYIWGATEVSDAFIIALTIPGTICDLLIQSIAVGFIPTYVEVKATRGKNGADSFTIGFLELLLLCCIPLVFIVIVCPKSVVYIFASGFNESTRTMATSFIRITIISIFSKIIVSVLSGYLNSNNSYIVATIIGVPFDIIIIIGIILAKYCCTIILPTSVVIGGGVQALLLILTSLKGGMFIRPTKHIFTENTLKIAKLVLPLLIIVGTNQINTLVDKSFASYIQVGAITILDYANKICLMVENIVVFSIVAILYPRLSETAETDKNLFASYLREGTEKIIRFLFPASFVIILLAEPIVSIIFGRGAFTRDDVLATSVCMVSYSIGIVFVAMKAIYTRALYSYHKVNTVSIISVITLATNVVLDYLLGKAWGLKGLALATSFASILSSALMYLYLRKENEFIKISNLRNLLYSAFISLIIIITVYLANLLCNHITNQTITQLIKVGVGGIVYCIGVFIIDKYFAKG